MSACLCPLSFQKCHAAQVYQLHTDKNVCLGHFLRDLEGQVSFCSLGAKPLVLNYRIFMDGRRVCPFKF